MCNFFSFCTQPSASSDFYYFDWQARLNMNHVGADSHSHICAHFGINEDQCNKWEYNPLTKELYLDMQNDPKTDTKRVKKWVDKLDWNTIVAPLIIKPIINPLELPAVDTITDEQISWLKEWASVRASVRDSVWDSVGVSIVDSVRDSVGASVWDSVGDSVGDSFGASFWDSVWAYSGTFFNLPRSAWKYTENIPGEGYPFQPAVTLWELGLVPSFDGRTWRLHGGPDGRVLWEGVISHV